MHLIARGGNGELHSILGTPTNTVSLHHVLKTLVTVWFMSKGRQILIVHLKELDGLELEQLSKCSKNEVEFSSQRKRGKKIVSRQMSTGHIEY